MNSKNNIRAAALCGIAVFIYLVVSFVLYRSQEINGWVGLWYGVDYSIGFSSRLFIGTLLHGLFGEVITVQVANSLINVCFIVIFVMFSYVVSSAIYVSESNEKRIGIAYIVLLFLTSPASFGYLWTEENMGRLETYLVLISLLMVLCAMLIKQEWLLVCLLVIMGIIALAIHQVYLLIFFPIVVAIILNVVFKSGNNRKILAGFVSIILLGVVGLFFQFGTSIVFDNPLDLQTYIQNRTELYVAYGPIEQEYFWQFKDHYVNNYLPQAYERAKYGFMTVVLLTPIWVILSQIWVDVFKSTKERMLRIQYTLTLACNLSFVPAFVFLTDWGRWFAAFVVVQVLILLYLFCKRDENVCYAICKLGNRVVSYPLVFGAIILYLSLFEKFQGCNYLKQVVDLYHFAYNLIH